MWMQDTYEGYEGKYWSLPPRKILPKPYGKPHPPMWYAAGNTSSYAMAARKGLGVLGFSVQSLEELAPVLEAYKDDDRRTRSPIGAFVNDNMMITHGRVRRARTAEGRDRDMVDGEPDVPARATCSATTTRSRTPTGCRSGPSSSPSPTSTTLRGARSAGRRRWSATPDHALGSCAALGERGRRPARVRHRPRHPRGHARDDPAHRRARDPEARHRPRAPHDPIPRGSRGGLGLGHLSRVDHARSRPTGTSTKRDRRYSPSPFACGS